MKKWILRLFLPMLLCLLTAGCDSGGEEETGGYQIWYMNQEETRLDYEYRELQAKNTEGLLKEALELLRDKPENESCKPAIPENVRIESYQIEHDQLYLNFSMEYLDMPKVYEVLCREDAVSAAGYQLCGIPGGGSAADGPEGKGSGPYERGAVY